MSPGPIPEVPLRTVRRLAALAVLLSVAVLPAPPAVAARQPDVPTKTVLLLAPDLGVASRVAAERATRDFNRRPAPPVAPPKAARATKPAVVKAAKSSARPAKTVAAMPIEASGRAAAVVAFALAQVGDPYVWGAAGPNRWDCSGLIMGSFAQIGIRLPHNADAIGRMGRAVPRAQWRSGTVIAFGGHVALYLGANRMVEAAHAGVPVRVTTARPGNGRWLF